MKVKKIVKRIGQNVGVNAKNYVQKKFSWNRVVERMGQVAERIGH